MFIQTETTPNPATLKFLPGCAVTAGGVVDFNDIEAAQRSPLAARLFAIDGIAGIMLGSDFIAVSCRADGNPDALWADLRPILLGAIMDHYESGDPVLLSGQDHDDSDTKADDDPIIVAIRELIDMRVRPAVARDGGDIIFRGFRDGVVLLHLRGACDGCPSAAMTLKHGIEKLLQHYIPEVREVRAL